MVRQRLIFGSRPKSLDIIVFFLQNSKQIQVLISSLGVEAEWHVNQHKIYIFKSWLLLIIRVVVGSVFLISGFSKIITVSEFAVTISLLTNLPHALALITAIVVAGFELLFGVCLTIGLLTRFSSAAITILLVLFLAVIVHSLIAEQNINCGCFGSWTEDKIDGVLLTQDLFLFCLTLIIFNRSPQRWSLDSLIKSIGGHKLRRMA